MMILHAKVWRACWLIALTIIPLALSGGRAVGQSSTAEPTSRSDSEPGFADLPTQGDLYQPITFYVTIDPSRYQNPFDSNDIELIGVFESPSGAQLVLPGYWWQPYADHCTAPCPFEDLQPSGDPEWQVRFTPREVGEWKYTLQVRDDGAGIGSRDGVLMVNPSDARGFVTLGQNRRYFQFDDGTAYFPIGHNLLWSWQGAGGVYAYDRWFKSLSEHGGNYVRLLIDEPWFIGLEWQSVGNYAAAQVDAARLDMILDMAAKYHIELQLILLWHQALQVYTGPPVLVPDSAARADSSADWNANPYNTVHGGPIAGPSLFFVDEAAQGLFRRRLRYISARWGSDPRIFAWEIVDELDQTASSGPQISAAWLQDAVGYLRQIDSGRHLIASGSRNNDPTLSANALADFSEGQFYQRLPVETVGEQETSVISLVRQRLSDRPAPMLLAGYSLNPWYEPTASDPEGVHFQNTLWAAALSGAAGGAVSAWGDTYVVPQKLERFYGPLAAFSAGVDWPNLHLEPAEAGLLLDGDAYLPVRLTGFNRRIREPLSGSVEYMITADGVVPALADVPSYLYGQVYNARLRMPEHFRVTVPVDTYLEIGIRAVSDQGDARLVVTVDDRVAAEVAMDASTHNVRTRVPLLAGEHAITLDNTGTDWLEMDYAEVGALIAPARVLTLRDATAGVALAWLQHRDYTWDKVASGVTREPILFTYRLDGMPTGRYTVEIWDPLGGGVLGEDVVRVGTDGVLRVELLPMDRQMALRAFRLPDDLALAPLLTAQAPAVVPLMHLIEQLGTQTPVPLTTLAAPASAGGESSSPIADSSPVPAGLPANAGPS